MTRCRQTDALLDAAFAGFDLTRAQADHAATCAECAHALAQLRRFDGELERIGHELAPEPIPSWQEPTHPEVFGISGGSKVRWQRAAVGGLATVAFVALTVFLGGRWIGSMVADSPSVGDNPVTSTAVDGERRERAARVREAEAAGEAAEAQAREKAMRVELDHWLAVTLSGASSPLDAKRGEVDVVRAELCGSLAIVTLLQDGGDKFWWVAGAIGADSAQGGPADAANAAELAAARGTTTDPCVRIADLTPIGAILAATRGKGGVPPDAELLGAAWLTRDTAIAVLEGTPPGGVRQRWLGPVAFDGIRWTMVPSSWVGANIAANDGLTAYDLAVMMPTVSDASLVVGRLPAEATSVELIVEGNVYRYDVSDGSEIVLVAPITFTGTAQFRILSPTTVAEGVIEQ